MKQWCVAIDAGRMPTELTSYLTEHPERDNQLKCAGYCTTDIIPPTDERQQNFMTQVEQMEQVEENQLEQNVSSADIQWPNHRSSLPETLTDSLSMVTAVDLDQSQEDWTDILQCCDFSLTGAD